MVRLRLPPGMTPEQGRIELRRSIGFGQAEVQLVYILEDPPDESQP